MNTKTATQGLIEAEFEADAFRPRTLNLSDSTVELLKAAQREHGYSRSWAAEVAIRAHFGQTSCRETSLDSVSAEGGPNGRA